MLHLYFYDAKCQDSSLSSHFLWKSPLFHGLYAVFLKLYLIKMFQKTTKRFSYIEVVEFSMVSRFFFFCSKCVNWKLLKHTGNSLTIVI